MALTSAILTGFTGIRTNQFAVETIGNNVANVNTTGFKNSRALFETLLSRTVNSGTAASGTSGGTNPIQFGYGSTLATTQRSFSQGTTERTGVVSDLAVDGEGFFILDRPGGGAVYTRDGAFSLNTQNELVSASGALVQGFAASADGVIDPGVLSNLQIPLGELSNASATTEATLGGILNAAAEPALTGAVSTSATLQTTGGAAATASTALTSLVDSDNVPLFADADVISVSGVQKGGIDIPDAQFVVGTDGNTLGDFATFFESVLGIDTSAPAIGTPGVTVSDGTVAPAGALTIVSNAGDVNAISIDGASIRNSTSGALPFEFTSTPASGEGVTTSFLVFDSLGTPVEARLRLVLESKTAAGNLWRFTAESGGGAGLGTPLGGGTVTFDQNGRFVAASGTQISINRGNTGAVDPLTVNLDFSGMSGLTASDDVSTIAMIAQDGFPEGTLTGFEIAADGVISGTFSNGQKRDLGQVALATFANNQGLIGQSQNTFAIGSNSGPAVVTTPLTGASGRINSGELELSNVDLSRELIGLITASTGFSAASRTVRTADDMLQELLLLVR